MFCVTYGNGWCFIILYNISVPFQQGWWRGFLKIHAENIPLLSLSNVTLIVKESRLTQPGWGKQQQQRAKALILPLGSPLRWHKNSMKISRATSNVPFSRFVSHSTFILAQCIQMDNFISSLCSPHFLRDWINSFWINYVLVAMYIWDTYKVKR